MRVAIERLLSKIGVTSITLILLKKGGCMVQLDQCPFSSRVQRCGTCILCCAPRGPMIREKRNGSKGDEYPQ